MATAQPTASVAELNTDHQAVTKVFHLGATGLSYGLPQQCEMGLPECLRLPLPEAGQRVG